MPGKHHIIQLNPTERQALVKASQNHRLSALEKMRGRVLLSSDINCPREEGGSRTDKEIAADLKISPFTVSNVRRRAHERGTLECLTRANQLNRKARKLDGAAEAHLIAITCSSPPPGTARWTLRLVRERLVELEVVEQIGLETIRETLKKMN
jgi:transposase